MISAPVRRVEGDHSNAQQDVLAVEEPLQIRLAFQGHFQDVSITMRTPGHDFELAAGFLYAEGILERATQIRDIRCGPGRNSVTVELASGVLPDIERLQRHFYTTSSCGVCGKASIEALGARECPMLNADGPIVDARVIHRLPDTLRRAQAVFARTGGLHAAALFDTRGELLNLREDVGRHNAVDKLIGAEFLRNALPLSHRIILVSGRASFELMQKALMAGIPILAAVGAPSSLAVEVALRFNMTLAGFVRERRFNLYSGAWRICGAGER